jgi:hypothetical protein
MSTLHELGKDWISGSNLSEVNAGITAGLPCSGKERNYPECNDSRCSRGSSSCEPIQQAGYKPLEQIDFVGINAVASDHPRSLRNRFIEGKSEAEASVKTWSR